MAREDGRLDRKAVALGEDLQARNLSL